MPLQGSPLFAIFPGDDIATDPPPLLSVASAVLALVLHANLALLLYLKQLPFRFRVGTISLQPLSYAVSYGLSAVVPVLCVLLGFPWQVIAWWCLTPAVIAVFQTVQSSISHGNTSISELEKLKYVARGA